MRGFIHILLCYIVMRIDWDIVIFGIIVKALLFACINRLPTRKQLGETQKLLWIPPVDSFQLGDPLSTDNKNVDNP